MVMPITNFRFGAILIIYTFMQNLSLKARNTIKCDTSLESYDHSEFKLGAWKQI